MTGDGLAAALAAIVGPAHVLTADDERAGYEIDWTRRWHGRARLVVRPGSATEVAAVVQACGEAGAVIVPQGGNTGLVGGGVPRGGEVVLSTRRLEGCEPVDGAELSVVAGAGTTLAAVQRVAAAAGLAFGVDLAARDSATVGGMVATDAGGLHVLRYGTMRRQLLGVEAVLASGETVDRLRGPAQHASGYDLSQLLAGSEGTLGVITRVRLRLVPALAHRVVALVGVDGPAAAVALTSRLRAGVPSLAAVEVFHHDGLELVVAHRGMAPPFASSRPTYVLAEAASTGDPTDELAAALADEADVAVASDSVGRDRLWALREGHTEAVSVAGVPHKLDVALPLAAIAAFEQDVRSAVAARWPGAQVITFGHLAEGNLHVNVLGPPSDDTAVDDVVLGLVVAAGGSISAEHGIGVAKRDWLLRSRGHAEVAAMRAVKAALDPAGLLNPGAVFGPD